MSQFSYAASAHPHWPSVSKARWLAMLGLLVVALAAVGWLAIAKTQGRATLRDTAALRQQQGRDLTATLTRSGMAAGGMEVDVILTTPTFFQLTNRPDEAATLGADKSVTFVANQNIHYGALPPRFAAILRVDGHSLYIPTDEKVLADAVHHRTSALVFGGLPVSALDGSHNLELLLPSDGAQRAVLQWETPIDYPASAKGRGLSLGLIVSLAAGLLAAISPCLLQLTAFYLPTLAGVNAGAAAAGLSENARRRKVLGTAAVFVLGFTIPYTAGGAIMGGLGQVAVNSQALSNTGPVTIGAGVVMIAMGILVAYRSRAPLVCKLPLPASLNSSGRVPWVQSFVSGFAIATGCLACFGGAILGVLLVYAGLLGSPLLGALAMFVFCLGLAIPFMLAAVGFSWLLPAAMRLQRASPAIGLATAAVMLFFGVIMGTGHFHDVSGWLYQHLPLA
ncbi:MAG: hypothetical protein KGJ86_01675 [Chloroflexota bacterium]|nr:hypothetical protein [Chloroflexota bacterium]